MSGVLFFLGFWDLGFAGILMPCHAWILLSCHDGIGSRCGDTIGNQIVDYAHSGKRSMFSIRNAWKGGKKGK